MKSIARKIAVDLFAVVIASGIALGAPATHATRTLTGIVTDAECGMSHNMMKGMSDADCTRMCVKAGSAYGLIVGDNVYKLRGHSAELNKHAGEKVTVRGAKQGKDFVVESVAPAK